MFYVMFSYFRRVGKGLFCHFLSENACNQSGIADIL